MQLFFACLLSILWLFISLQLRPHVDAVNHHVHVCSQLVLTMVRLHQQSIRSAHLPGNICLFLLPTFCLFVCLFFFFCSGADLTTFVNASFFGYNFLYFSLCLDVFTGVVHSCRPRQLQHGSDRSLVVDHPCAVWAGDGGGDGGCGVSF